MRRLLRHRAGVGNHRGILAQLRRELLPRSHPGAAVWRAWSFTVLRQGMAGALSALDSRPRAVLRVRDGAMSRNLPAIVISYGALAGVDEGTPASLVWMIVVLEVVVIMWVFAMIRQGSRQ
jgi:hypothetical protein